jgi:hypothetical protein
MSEIEAAALDGAGGWFKRRKPAHPLPIGSPCPNCTTVLQGPWCHACGQVAEDFHRSVGKLFVEVVESFTHVDGRFWQTLPKLILRPATLTRSYIEGHRAVQIPPLRLFLVVLLTLFLVGSVTGGGQFGRGVKVGWVAGPDSVTPAKTAKPGPDARALNVYRSENLNVNIAGKPKSALSAWLRERAERAMANPETFQLILEQWSERFAFLMLPIATALMSLLFAFQRRFYIFDHTIFALHSLSFQGLLLSTLFLMDSLGSWADWPVFVGLLLIPAAHLFVHMRGVYGTGIPGTLVRMVILGVGSLFGFFLLMFGLLWVGLNAMGTA